MDTALPEFQAVIFDMDGLVLDSEPTYAFAWQKAGEAFDVQLDSGFLHGLFGRHADDVEAALAQKIGAGFDRERYLALAVRYWKEHITNHGIAMMPGLEKLLALLDRFRLPYALATNSDGPYANECLRLAGLHGRFPLIVTRDQVAAGKPEPDLFLEAARRLGFAPSQCLVLEDSHTGLLAARKAGAIPVLVLDGLVAEETAALARLYCNTLDGLAGKIAARLELLA